MKRIFQTIVSSIFLLGLAACSLFRPAFKGEQLSPLASAPEINMTDQNGNPFSLAGMQGRVVLLFFGFTNCVDECPTTLAHIKLALSEIDGAADKVQVVLVTTDPLRDTPMALQDFLGKFDPAYLGITGAPADIKQIWQNYDVQVLDGGETHSSFVYVIDQQGNLRLRIDAETDPKDIASDVKLLLGSE